MSWRLSVTESFKILSVSAWDNQMEANKELNNNNKKKNLCESRSCARCTQSHVPKKKKSCEYTVFNPFKFSISVQLYSKCLLYGLSLYVCVYRSKNKKKYVGSSSPLFFPPSNFTHSRHESIKYSFFFCCRRWIEFFISCCCCIYADEEWNARSARDAHALPTNAVCNITNRTKTFG